MLILCCCSGEATHLTPLLQDVAHHLTGPVTCSDSLCLSGDRDKQEIR